MCLLADAASAMPDGKLYIHGGGITRLTPTQLPWRHPSLALVLRFQIADEDIGRTHEIGLQVVFPDGEEHAPIAAMPVKPRRAATEGEENYAQAVIQLANLPVETAGFLRFDVTLNGDTIRSLPVAVIAPGTKRVPN
jgi:hypothetical protein